VDRPKFYDGRDILDQTVVRAVRSHGDCLAVVMFRCLARPSTLGRSRTSWMNDCGRSCCRRNCSLIRTRTGRAGAVVASR